MRRVLAEPMFTFFVLGLLLFTTYNRLQGGGREIVRLGNGTQAVLVAEFEQLTGRSAQAVDVDRLVREYFLAEVLLREGLKAGLPLTDSAIRAAVVESMQQRVSGEIPEPTGRDLVAFYADNMDRYYSEATMTVRQVFFQDPPADVAGLIADLEAGAQPAGDEAWQGRVFPDYGVSMLRGLFGADLLEALRSLPLDTWQGPFSSPDGWHFFRVDARTAPRLLAFEDVHPQLLVDYQSAALQSKLASYMATQRENYQLVRGGVD